MQLTCNCCNNTADERYFLECSVCSKTFQLSCIDVSKAEASKIRNHVGLTWSCKTCRNISVNLTELKQVIITLQAEIKDLKASFNNASAPALSPVDFERVVQELMDRNSRRSNVIVYGLKETTSMSKANQTEYDSRSITEIFSKINVEVDGEVRVHRLGRFDPTNSNLRRPIKVCLSNESAVSLITKNSKKLKSLENFKHISISPDRTPMQNALYRTVKSELEKRLIEGESDLIIKYVKGIPTIVNRNRSANSFTEN